MTYIGIREKAGHHTRRAVADRKVEEWKEKMEKESRGALIGSWLWRFHFSCFFVFRFSLLDKGNKKMRRRWKAQMPESPHGLLCIHTKNKMTAIIKVITKACLGHEPQAWKQRQYSQWAVVFCGAMCHGQKLPILKCTPTIKAEWRVLGFSFGRAIIRKAWKDWKWPRFAQAGTPCASSASFIFFFHFLLILSSLTPKPHYRLQRQAVHIQSELSGLLHKNDFITSYSRMYSYENLVMFFSLLSLIKLRNTPKLIK